jgi:hypothetical protein
MNTSGLLVFLSMFWIVSGICGMFTGSFSLGFFMFIVGILMAIFGSLK